MPKGYSCRAVLIHVSVIEKGFFSAIINFGDLMG